MAKLYEIQLTKNEIQRVLNALAFTACCDVCYDNGDRDETKKDNEKNLNVALKIKKATNFSCTDKVYLIADCIREDEKESEFVENQLNVVSK